MLRNLEGWFGCCQPAFEALLEFVESDMEGRHSTAFFAILVVATRVAGLPVWANAFNEATQLEQELVRLMQRCSDADYRERMTAQLPILANNMTALATRQLHACQQECAVERMAVPIPQTECMARYHTEKAAEAVLKLMLVVHDSAAVDAMDVLKRFCVSCARTESPSDLPSDSPSDSPPEYYDPADVSPVTPVATPVTPVAPVTPPAAPTDRKGRVEAFEALLAAVRTDLADARARAAGAEQIADEALARAEAAEKQAATVSKAAAKAAAYASCNLGKRVDAAEAVVATSSAVVLELQQRVSAAEDRAATAEDRAATAEDRAATAEDRAATAEDGLREVTRRVSAVVKAATDNGVARRLKALEGATTTALDGLARRLEALEKRAPVAPPVAAADPVTTAALDGLAQRLKALEGEDATGQTQALVRLEAQMSWLLPQFQLQFCRQWNGVQQQLEMQQRLYTPYVMPSVFYRAEPDV